MPGVSRLVMCFPLPFVWFYPDEGRERETESALWASRRVGRRKVIKFVTWSEGLLFALRRSEGRKERR